MTQPDYPEAVSAVVSHLKSAERFEADLLWSDADSQYACAVGLDRSPASRIAYGSSLARRERYYDALAELTMAMDCARECGDLPALAVINHNLAAIYREVGDADLARRFQQRALIHQDDCGSLDLLGLANDAWQCQKPDLAECLAESAVEMSDDEPEDVTTAIRATHAVMLGLTSDPRLAIRTLIEVARSHQDRREWRDLGIDFLNLATLCGEMGWTRREISLVRTAIAHFHRAGAGVSAAWAGERLELLQRYQQVRDFDPSRN